MPCTSTRNRRRGGFEVKVKVKVKLKVEEGSGENQLREVRAWDIEVVDEGCGDVGGGSLAVFMTECPLI